MYDTDSVYLPVPAKVFHNRACDGQRKGMMQEERSEKLKVFVTGGTNDRLFS